MRFAWATQSVRAQRTLQAMYAGPGHRRATVWRYVAFQQGSAGHCGAHVSQRSSARCSAFGLPAVGCVQMSRPGLKPVGTGLQAERLGKSRPKRAEGNEGGLQRDATAAVQQQAGGEQERE